MFQKLKGLESSCALSHDQHLGYLTCNPEWLGTGLRIKTIVQLEKAANENVKLELINIFCRKYGVVAKQLDHDMYELSLVKTFQLGRTETDLVSGFIDCLYQLLHLEEQAILAEEKTLRNILKSAKDMPKFDEVNTSLIKPFITPEIWSKYGSSVTKLGHTLSECIKPGIANHKIGLVAMDYPW